MRYLRTGAHLEITMSVSCNLPWNTNASAAMCNAVVELVDTETQGNFYNLLTIPRIHLHIVITIQTVILAT
jgi:hypothetical protein